MCSDGQQQGFSQIAVLFLNYQEKADKSPFNITISDKKRNRKEKNMKKVKLVRKQPSELPLRNFMVLVVYYS